MMIGEAEPPEKRQKNEKVGLLSLLDDVCEPKAKLDPSTAENEEDTTDHLLTPLPLHFSIYLEKWCGGSTVIAVRTCYPYLWRTSGAASFQIPSHLLLFQDLLN